MKEKNRGDGLGSAHKQHTKRKEEAGGESLFERVQKENAGVVGPHTTGGKGGVG